MTVTKLTTATIKLNDGLIDALEHCLSMARSGEMQDMVIVGDISGRMYYANCSFDDGARLLGHLSRAAFAVNETLRCDCD